MDQIAGFKNYYSNKKIKKKQLRCPSLCLFDGVYVLLEGQSARYKPPQSDIALSASLSLLTFNETVFTALLYYGVTVAHFQRSCSPHDEKFADRRRTYIFNAQNGLFFTLY